ncbi:MAG: epoxide hydrolase family protein [Thermoanaerobaculia bacterium]
MINRRHFLAVAAATTAASSRRLRAMTETVAAQETAVRPFRVNFSPADVADLRRRVQATKWPERETVNDTSQGVQFNTVRKLANYWATDHDWSKCEAKLKALPHFVTNIDGLDIHFLHVKSKHPNALPIIVTHGWPGSVIEQLKIIDPLTNPTAHGGSASDAFDVVIPSLPGYGFSAKTTAPGWDVPRIAQAWITLMKRLGYSRFVAQGGDWGNAVSEVMGLIAPPELLAISTNMAATVPPEIAKALAAGDPPPADLTPDEFYAWKQLDFFYKKGLGYANEMALRPQTLYALTDSPVGLAAWILDHDAQSYDLIVRVFDGVPEGLTRDDILDNITFYWLTNTAVSSARLYWEAVQKPSKGGFFDARGVKIPVSVTVFPHEIYAAPQTWATRAYSNLLYYKRHDKGTHFAAWEQPALLTADLRESFRSLR